MGVRLIDFPFDPTCLGPFSGWLLPEISCINFSAGKNIVILYRALGERLLPV